MKNALLSENIKSAIELLGLMLTLENLSEREIMDLNDKILGDISKIEAIYDEEMIKITSKTPSNIEEELKQREEVLRLNSLKLEINEMYEEVASDFSIESMSEENKVQFSEKYSKRFSETSQIREAVELSAIQYDATLEKLEYIKDDKKLIEIEEEIANIEMQKAELKSKLVENEKYNVPFEQLKEEIMSKLNSEFAPFDNDMDELNENKKAANERKENVLKALEIAKSTNMDEKVLKLNKNLIQTNNVLEFIDSSIAQKEVYDVLARDPKNHDELNKMIRDMNTKAVMIKGFPKERLAVLDQVHSYSYTQMYLCQGFLAAQEIIKEMDAKLVKLNNKKEYIEKTKSEENIVVNNIAAVKTDVKENVVPNVSINYETKEEVKLDDSKPKININFEVKEVKKAKPTLLEKIKKSKFIKLVAAIAAGIILLSVLCNKPAEKVEEINPEDLLSNTNIEKLVDVDSSKGIDVEAVSSEAVDFEHVITVGDKVFIEENVDCFRTSGSTDEVQGLQSGEYNVNRISITDKQGKILAVSTDINTSAFDLASSLDLTLDDVLVYPHLGKIDYENANSKNDGFVEADKNYFDPTNDVAWVMGKDVKVIETNINRNLAEGKVR